MRLWAVLPDEACYLPGVRAPGSLSRDPRDGLRSFLCLLEGKTSLQVLPALEAGGVERGTLQPGSSEDIAAALREAGAVKMPHAGMWICRSWPSTSCAYRIMMAIGTALPRRQA